MENRVGRWGKGCLLLFDRFGRLTASLGDSCSHLFFDRIYRNGGFFLTRWNANANPLIVAVHRQWRGQRLERVGTCLKEVLPRLKRQVLDVDVEVEFKWMASLGSQSRAHRPFRLIAIRHEEPGDSHVSLTTLPADTRLLPKTCRSCTP